MAFKESNLSENHYDCNVLPTCASCLLTISATMNRSISWPGWSTCSSVSWTHFWSDIVTTTTSFLRVSRMFPITAFKKNEQELWPIAVYNTMRNTRKNLVTLNKYGYGWRNKLNQLELHVISIDIAHKHSQIQIWRGLDFGGLRQIWSYFPTDELFLTVTNSFGRGLHRQRPWLCNTCTVTPKCE